MPLLGTLSESMGQQIKLSKVLYQLCQRAVYLVHNQPGHA